MICRVGASGCALHREGRIVVRGMMISGDSSACGSGAVHNTFRRIARVASRATFDFKDVKINGKKETKNGKVRYSDDGAWAMSTNDAKEGLDESTSRSRPRLIDVSCCSLSLRFDLPVIKRTNARSIASSPSFQPWRETGRWLWRGKHVSKALCATELSTRSAHASNAAFKKDSRRAYHEPNLAKSS